MKKKVDRGRPTTMEEPKTPLAKRLRLVFFGEKLVKIAELLGISDKTARNYLTGDTEPPPAILKRIREKRRVREQWILTEEGPVYVDPKRSEVESPDPDLDKVIAAWPNLPEHIKKAIISLIEAERGKR